MLEPKREPLEGSQILNVFHMHESVARLRQALQLIVLIWEEVHQANFLREPNPLRFIYDELCEYRKLDYSTICSPLISS